MPEPKPTEFTIDKSDVDRACKTFSNRYLASHASKVESLIRDICEETGKTPAELKAEGYGLIASPGMVITFGKTAFSQSSEPKPTYFEPRAVVSWCPEEVAERFGVSGTEADQFLESIEDELEEKMTQAGHDFISDMAEAIGWEEVDG